MIQFFAKKINNKKGFTLIELLIVIAVLGILAALAAPRFLGVANSFKVKTDQESAKIVSRQVEVMILANKDDFKISSSTGSAYPTLNNEKLVDKNLFGEDLPQGQVLQGPKGSEQAENLTPYVYFDSSTNPTKAYISVYYKDKTGNPLKITGLDDDSNTSNINESFTKVVDLLDV